MSMGWVDIPKPIGGGGKRGKNGEISKKVLLNSI
jgi:hypothetical protein